MKKIFALFSGWALFLMPLCAQTPAVAPENRTLPAKSVTDDPSVLAMRESQRLQQQLSLDAKQTKKVYKLYYKHFKKQTPQSQGFGGPGMGGPGGMGRGPGMGGPGGMPGGGPGGFGEPGARHPGSELPGP